MLLRPIQDENGLTLLEVLVAAVLLGLVLVAVFNLFTVGTRLEVDAHRHMEALRLAEAEVERFKAVPYAAVAAPEAPREAPGRHGTYLVAVDVAEHEAGKTVTVTVSYREQGQDKSVSLTMERGRW